MTANLLALRRRKRAFAMKRLLMPAPALTTLKKLAFTLFCCTLLMVFAAPAQTPHQVKTDPGNNDGPPAGAIYDLNGMPIPGGGNGMYQYYSVSFVAGLSSTAITFAFRDDPAFISFDDASVTDVSNPSAPGPNLLLNGDFSSGPVGSDTPTGWTYANIYGATYGGVVDSGCGIVTDSNPGGNCWYDGAVQAYDAISQTIATSTGHTYQISFWVAENSGCGCNFSDLSTNGDTTDTGGNGIDVTVYAQAGLPPPSQNELTVTETGLGAGNVTDTYNTSSPPPAPIDCTEAGGGVAQTGVCSETDANGTMVTLMETPGTTAGEASTFGGWGGACANSNGTPNTSPTCTVTMNSAQNVTASFVAPPVSFELTFNPGTNVTQSALVCYGQPLYPPDPCSDPDASELTISIPVVYTQFSLTLMVTEFSDNGLCSPTETVFTSVACRFGSFFNYGTDPNGNTIAPLPFAYLNGNSAQYLLYPTATGPGTSIPSSYYSGDLYLDIGFLNISGASNLPSYWAGSPAPRVLDDPDSNEFPGVPYGTNCSYPMLVGSSGMQYSPAIYCQFDEDITTFYTPGASLNSPGGGKIPANNNFVMAFLPTTTGTNPVQTPPAPTAPTIAGNCVGGPGCALSGSTITFTEGTGGTFGVSVTNSAYPSATLTETGMLPSGLTFNMATGLISGTPADGAAGNYSIMFSATNSAGSATLSYTLTVAPAPLAITASSGMMTYGGPPPTITPSFMGLVNGDTTPGTVTCTTNATSSSPVGTYTSSCSATDSTYAITSVPGAVTVGPAPLTIVASSATMTYGGTVPTITPSFTGLVNGDSAATLGVTCTTTATSSSLPGSYPSTCTASHGTNYTITYVNGTVTVLGLEISPLSVNFGTLYLDQFGIQGIVLKNTTSTPITITSITLGGGSASSDYGDLTFCPPMILKLPATLPEGKSCAVGVGIFATAMVFSPTASTAYLTITDSGASQQVLLTAQVINPQASFSSTYLSLGKLTFPTTTVGLSNEQTIRVTNPGNTPLTIVGTPTISSSSGDFTLTSTSCTNATINSAAEGGLQSCLINVTFTPKASGTFTGTLKVTDNALFSTQTITLAGTT
jgi:hypothetical protein